MSTPFEATGDGGNRFRKMPPREFVRRFRHGVKNQDVSFSWLIGAGCSAGSGVPTAGDCVRMWMKALKYFETGQHRDIESWAAKRFVRYDPNDPAAIYGEVLHALFYTEQDRRREMDRLTEAAEPSFGYAALAQLMSHEKWGPKSNIVVSANFDDLAFDALNMFSRLRPQYFSQDTLGRHTPVSTVEPAIVKVWGDAHLPAAADDGNRPRLRPEARQRLREMITETALIIVGYGGRDESILGLLEELDPEAPMGGVYWINDHPPRGAFGEWMENRGAIWVQHADFDELMYFVRLEFGLGHPQIERFERILRKYDAQYDELSTRAGLRLSSTPSAASDAGAEAGKTSRNFNLKAPGAMSSRRITEESRQRRMRESVGAVSRVIANVAKEHGAKNDQPDSARRPLEALIDDAKFELSGGARLRRDRGRRGKEETGASDRSPTGAKGTASVRRKPQGEADADPNATPQTDDDARDAAAAAAVRESVEAVLMRLGDKSELEIPAFGAERGSGRIDAGAANRNGDDSTQNDPAQNKVRDIGHLLQRRRQRRELETEPEAPGGARSRRRGGGAALELVPPPRFGSGGDASSTEAGDAEDGLPPEPLGLLPARQAASGEAAFLAAIENDPEDGALRARFARFLALGVQDAERAEAAFEEAQQLAPDNVSILREYSRFALEQLRDGARAERLLTRALDLGMRNPDTLRALAAFMLRARGQVEQAENCYRIAIELEPSEPAHLLDFARFSLEWRGRRDVAETALRKASEIQPRSARALAELALFCAVDQRALDAAEMALSGAEDVDPHDAVACLARAVLAEHKSNLDEAEAEFRAAIDADPREQRAQIGFAEFLAERRGDLDAAEGQFRAAINAAPFAARPLSAFASFLDSHRDEPDRAEKLHRQALKLETHNPQVMAAYAEHLSGKSGREEEAEKLFQDALALNPRAVNILRAYARFLEHVKEDKDAAEKQLRAAVRANPESAEALDELAQFLHTVREDSEAAEEYFREALQCAPDSAETLHRFAVFLRETRRDLGEAEDLFRRAVSRNRKDGFTLARAAQFLLAQGRRKEGLKVLNDAFDAVWQVPQRARPLALVLELWFYRFAHDPSERKRDQAREAILELMDSGVRSDGWDLDPTLAEAERSSHPDLPALKDLARVATDGGDPVILTRHRAS